MTVIALQTKLAPAQPAANGAPAPRATTIIAEHRKLQIPSWVTDLASFRRWADLDEFPENARICYLQGELWVDLTMEQIFTHNALKTAVTVVLYTLVTAGKLGRFFSDGVRISHVGVDLSAEPDGLFVSYTSLEQNKAQFIPGKEGGFVEVEGTADMALEIVSTSSETKDLETLFDLYWQAGIAEYWLMDARGDDLVFEIYHRGSKGYVATRKQAGWVKSKVFGQSFRVMRDTDSAGLPRFTLEMK
jgi:Uma2 family endonuclease